MRRCSSGHPRMAPLPVRRDRKRPTRSGPRKPICQLDAASMERDAVACQGTPGHGSLHAGSAGRAIPPRAPVDSLKRKYHAPQGESVCTQSEGHDRRRRDARRREQDDRFARDLGEPAGVDVHPDPRGDGDRRPRLSPRRRRPQPPNPPNARGGPDHPRHHQPLLPRPVTWARARVGGGRLPHLHLQQRRRHRPGARLPDRSVRPAGRWDRPRLVPRERGRGGGDRARRRSGGLDRGVTARAPGR